jgi:hypothetical protein
MLTDRQHLADVVDFFRSFEHNLINDSQKTTVKEGIMGSKKAEWNEATIEPEIKEDIIQVLRDDLLSISADFEYCISIMKDPDCTPALATNAKGALLVNILDTMPISGATCVYCKQMFAVPQLICGTCPFGKEHNQCDSINSEWKKVRAAKSALASLINRVYCMPKKI